MHSNLPGCLNVTARSTERPTPQEAKLVPGTGLEPAHLATGRRTWYHVERNVWSVHFNSSPDGRRFAGDGGDPEMVAKAPDGKWIYLFEPEGIPDVAGISAPGAETLVHPGRLRARRLVNLGANDYRVEPNVRFSPDGRWVIFRANLEGAVHTYAVDTIPAAPGP